MTDPRDYDPFPHAPKAGRELDALVAEKVMGVPSWRVHYLPEDVDKSDNWALSRTITRDFTSKADALQFAADNKMSRVPDWAQASLQSGGPICKYYSTDIAAAWEVVERLISDDWVLTLESNSTGHHAKLGKVITAHIVERQGFADTAPLAICLAALKAVEL